MRRTIGAVCLIGAPLLLGIQVLLMPELTSDVARQLDAMATDPQSAALAGLAAIASLVMLAVAVLTLGRLAGDGTLASIGLGIAFVGIVTQPIWLGIDGGMLALAEAGGSEQAALGAAIQDSMAAMIAAAGAVLMALGSVLLGIALLRAGTVWAGAGVALILGPAALVAGFASATTALLAAAAVIQLVGFTPVALRLLRGEAADMPAATAATAPA